MRWPNWVMRVSSKFKVPSSRFFGCLEIETILFVCGDQHTISSGGGGD